MSQGLSFGAAADLYDDIRPSYPPAALRWALGTDPLRVLDLGAGTGILTRLLRALGHDVVPVEPDEAMRARLARSTAGVAPLAGSAERIPLPDGSVDAVVSGQAYHWFDPEPAHREIARVLVPGGVLAPIWNVRDESVPWVRRLALAADGELDQDSRMHEGLADHDFGPQFGPIERADFPQEVSMTADRLVRLMSSRSYYLTAPPGRRAAIEAAVRAGAADLPATFPLPYITVAYRATRR